MLFFMIILIWLGVTPSFSIPPGGVTRTNYGVDFNFLYPINNMHGSWKHIWSIDLALLDRELDFGLDLRCEAIDPMCKPAKAFIEAMRKASHDTSVWMFKQFEWVKKPSILQTLNRRGDAVSRSKRSILPFIGDLEKFLFGTATESDIAGIKKTLDDFTTLGEKTAHQVTSIGENLASLTKIVNSDMKNTEEGFKLVKQTFNNMTNQINKRFSNIMADLAQETNIIHFNSLAVGHTWASLESILPQMLDAVQLMVADTQLLQAIQTVLQGYLPIALVPPAELTRGLNIAGQGIKSQFPDATLTYPTDSLGFYYTHQLVTPYFDGKSLALIVDIPIDLGQETLYVYAIRTFPVSILPYNPYTRSVDPLSTAGVAQSELILRQDHFLISQDGSSWSLATETDLSSCVGKTIRTCKHQFPTYKFLGLHCIETIWNNDPFSKVLELCPYRLAHPGSRQNLKIHIQVSALTNGRWYIEAPLGEQWTITCPSRPPEKRSSCTSCVIQVDCGCGIDSKYFKIPTRASSCDSVFSPLHKNFTINPFNYQQRNHPWVVNLTGDDNFSSPPRALPDIRLPDSGAWDDVLESMDSKQYDLNKLYEKQVNETKIFRTEAEALLLKIKTQDKMLEALSGWPDWILGLMLALTFGNTAVIILICCWFFSHARAIPITEELNLLNRTDAAILDLEIIEFIIVCLCFTLLLILAWPIIMNWIHNNRMYRKFRGYIVRIKADGYRKHRGYQQVLLQGLFLFESDSQRPSRAFCGRCVLASVPQGTHLSRSGGNTRTEIRVIENKYYLEFPEGLTTVTPSEREVKCPGVFFAYDYVHRKCKVPMSTKWVSIRDCRVWIE